MPRPQEPNGSLLTYPQEPFTQELHPPSPPPAPLCSAPRSHPHCPARSDSPDKTSYQTADEALRGGGESSQRERERERDVKRETDYITGYSDITYRKRMFNLFSRV